MVASVIIATVSDTKRNAFESSEIATYLKSIGVEYKFVDADLCPSCDEFAGERFAQPYTASGGIFAALQRVAAIRQAGEKETRIIKHYDESGALIGNIVDIIDTPNDIVIIAIESYVTENAKDCVCVLVSYYVDGEKRDFISFSPACYIATFPDQYLQHLAAIEKYTTGVKGFKITIGDIIAANNHCDKKNWHKVYNSFDRVEQIRGTLNYIADEFKKILC
jgi:hypothetical protein